MMRFVLPFAFPSRKESGKAKPAQRNQRMSGASAHQLHPVYRPDIDGLRAVAVVSVVIFHAFPAFFPGGFVGVDVFFVISGFLITQIILREQGAGRFSFLSFYARRIRRILPALLMVLAASYAAGWFTLFSQDFKTLGLQIAGAAGFASNFILLSEAGYFDSASELKPLLHLWSLAIEEQFYVFWPALLVLAQRFRLPIPALTGVLLAASLAGCLWLTRVDPAAAFYLSPVRFWEILVGALLAGREIRHPAPPLPILALPGAALLVAAFALIDHTRAFPGAWALLPVLGTALVIAAGPQGRANRWLSAPWIVALGLVSYPLYLWHWPLLAYTRIVGGSAVPAWALGLAVVAALLLAILTYRLIERPIRWRAAQGRTAVLLLVALIGVGFAGFNVWQREGLRFRAANKANPEEFDWRGEWRHKTCFLEARDAKSAVFATQCAPEGAKVVLWGDSHGAALYPGFAGAARTRGIALTQFTAAGCPPVFDFAAGDRKECPAVTAHVRAHLAAHPPQVLVLAGFWTLYFGDNPQWNGLSEAKIEATLAELRTLGIQRIVLLGPLPGYKRDVPKFAGSLFRPGEMTRTRQELEEASFTLEPRLRALAQRNGLVYASPLETLCDAKGCLVTTSPERFAPVQWDAHHLTSAGARLVVEALLAKDPALLP